MSLCTQGNICNTGISQEFGWYFHSPWLCSTWLWHQFPESSLPVSTQLLHVNPFPRKAGPSQCRLVLLGVLNAFPRDSSPLHFPFHSVYSSAVEFVWFFLMFSCLLAKSFQSCLFVTPWIVAHQAPLSVGFARQGYWSGLPFPSQGLWFLSVCLISCFVRMLFSWFYWLLFLCFFVAP